MRCIMTETIEQQLRLLAIHRSNLAQLLEQQALHGFATTPLAILNAITLERAAIETTTQTLWWTQCQAQSLGQFSVWAPPFAL